MLKNKNKNLSETKEYIINDIKRTKKKLELAHINYEYAKEELIDYYLYEIKANQSKLDYLLSTARKDNLELDSINAIQVVDMEKLIVL